MHSRIIQNSPRAQMSTNRRMDKRTVVYSFNEIIYTNKNDYSTVNKETLWTAFTNTMSKQARHRNCILCVLIHSGCLRDYHRLDSLYNKHLFLTVLESGKVLEHSVPGKGPLPGSHKSTFLYSQWGMG